MQSTSTVHLLSVIHSEWSRVELDLLATSTYGVIVPPTITWMHLYSTLLNRPKKKKSHVHTVRTATISCANNIRNSICTVQNIWRSQFRTANTNRPDDNIANRIHRLRSRSTLSTLCRHRDRIVCTPYIFIHSTYITRGCFRVLGGTMTSSMHIDPCQSVHDAERRNN